MKRILTSFVLVFIVAHSAYSQTATVTTWKNEAQGAYSIIHDDYGSSVADGIWKYADTIAGNRGIKFSFGALTGECERRAEEEFNGYTGPYAYAKNVMIKEHGHEIIAHSQTHGCAVGGAGWAPCKEDGWAQTEGGFEIEIVQCTQSIEDGTGYKPRYYIYPYDRFNNAANERLKEEGYIGSRSGWTSAANEPYHRQGYNANDLNTFFPDGDGFFRTAVQIFGDVDESPNDHEVLNAAVDNAITRNEWANRELHDVNNNKAAWGTVSINGYRKHLDYVKQKVDNGELWVGTLSEIMTYQLQKLKYEPNITETAASTWEVEWKSINPQYDVDVAKYLEDLDYKTSLTLKVDFEGRSGEWVITQNGTPVPYTIKKKIFYLDVYPHQGTVTIELKNETFPAPVAENPVDDAQLPVEFDSFTIDLNYVFEDANTLDENLIYSVSNNTNIIVDLDDRGIASLSSTLDWEGKDTIIFSAEDESGKIGYDTVVYTVEGRNQPYTGSPIVIPAKIEAEDFDLGGKGVAYLEKDEDSNTTYREGDVDITGSDDVFFVSMNDGEWLEYTIEVTTTGYYDIDLYATTADENTSVNLSLNKEKLEVFSLTSSDDATSYKAYNIELKEGTHTFRVLASGKSKIDYINISEPGENTLPEVVTNILDQELPVNFVSFTINLNDVFEDLETKDEDLVYSVSGDTNVSISIEAGIATIESIEGWEGEETIIFSAEDFSGAIANDTVGFAVSASFASPNESVNNKQGYIFTFDQSRELNCPEKTMGQVFGQGYEIESVGGGNLVINSDGTQFGFHNITLSLNDECENTQIDLTHPDKRILEVRIHSTVDVPQFLLALGDTARTIADWDIQIHPLKANEWHTLTFKFNSLKTWGGKTMDATLIDFVTLQFRKSWHGTPQEIAGTFTIDYIKIGGAINPCPTLKLNQSATETLIDADRGKDISFPQLNATGGSGAYTYQWFRNDTLITDNESYSGTTTSQLVVNTFEESNAGIFYCEITDELCEASIKSQETELIIGDLNKPYNEDPVNLPGVIEAEHYDLGGQGVSFFEIEGDDDYGNDYRDDIVDIVELEDDEGYLVIDTRVGEWLEYTVNVVDSGTYTFEVLGYSWNQKNSILFSLDGELLTSVLVSDVDDGIYLNYQNDVFVPKGEHVLRVQFDGNFSLAHIAVRRGTPVVANEIEDIKLEQGFESYQIDLNKAFDDLETVDSLLDYGVLENENFTMKVTDGIVTITAPDTFVGVENLVFFGEDKDGFLAVATVQVTVEQGVGTTDLVNPSNLSVFPNPATSVLYITSDDHIDSDIQIIDVKGVEVMRHQNADAIDISELPSGIYILKQENSRVRFIKK